jgi:aerobic carbon-monoxide dehydrogenase large subunit
MNEQRPAQSPRHSAGSASAKPMKFGIGQPVRRVEDVRFITGRGNYTSDYRPAAALQVAFLRSPHARAQFSFTDLETARSMPGVAAVFTAEDFSDLGDLPCLAPVENYDGTMTPLKPYPVLPRDEVHHVGDLVAMTVAATAHQARDAAEAIGVEWTPMPAVANLEDAVAPGAPQVFSGAPGNLTFEAHIGNSAKTDEAFSRAARVVKLKVVNNRVLANYMETRAAIGEYDSLEGRYTLHVSSQGVHDLRDQLANVILKIPPERLRVVTNDVGGGFGTKIFMYREYPLVLAAAKKVGQAVSWVADRSEHFLGDAHGRDHVATAEMALDPDGRFLGLRFDVLGNLGAYLSQYAPLIPHLTGTMANGVYDIPAVFSRVRGVYTNTLPLDAYRGAGRPEAAYLLERLVDECAIAMSIPPDEIRVRNFVKPSQMPYVTATGRTYDVGDFAATLRVALANAEYESFEQRAEEAASRGKLRGIGIASYIECTAWGDSETAVVQLNSSGDLTLVIGSQSNGQGHETAYAQIVSQHLDVPLERVKLVQGDTDRVATGFGTHGSRSIPVGAIVVTRAAAKLTASLKDLASDHLEAAVADLEIEEGRILVAGTDRSVTYQEIANLPEATPDKLKASDFFAPPDATYPNGTHVCEVEIDPETGVTRIVRHTVVDDYGATINPLLLEGQIHGGIAQGLGQALFEKIIYDGDGQLLTASLQDYCVPHAADLPSYGFEMRNVPSTTNPLGVKGAGEAGSVGSTPAAMNAIVDALWRGYGARDLDMPATPFAVFKAIRSAAARRAPSQRA